MEYQKTTVVISQKDTADLIAELWCGEHCLGEISLENQITKLRIYPPPKNAWHLELDEFIAFLMQAKKELLEKVSANS